MGTKEGGEDVEGIHYEDDKESNRVEKSKETKIASAGRGVSEIEVGEISQRNSYEEVSEIGKVISSVFTCFSIVQRVDPVRLRGHIVSSAHSAVSPCGPAWPAARSGKLGWWSDELTQRVALWGNFGKNAFSLHFRNKFDLQN